MTLRGCEWTWACTLALVVAGCTKDTAQKGDELGSGTDGEPTDGAADDDDADGPDDGPDDGVSADGTGTTSAQTDDDDAPPDEGPKFDVAGLPDGGDGSCPAPPPPDATLTGTVYGPNGIIPVSGALVYVSEDQPGGIPQEVYCTECSLLDCNDQWTLTDADGSFTLPATSGAGKYIVVQKGQFLRITPYDVPAGPLALSDTVTTLPAANDPDNGEYIPLVAVGDGGYDRIEDALGKFGLGDTMIANMEERLVPGTESFDLWDNGRDPAYDGFVSQGTFEELVSDPELLAQYHIIFVPCSYDDYVDALSIPANVDNIRNWVAAGGRWYVADWSNEWLQMVFPEYQDLSNWDGSVGSADNGVYDSLADVLDPDLLEWLEALPAALKDINPLNNEEHPTLGDLPQVLTVDNWSGITTIHPVLVDDPDGGQVDVGHKVWLEGPGGQPAGIHPLTVTGQFGCGKIQFTSYHTAEFFNYVGLSPQELVLIYTILEIGTCQDPLPPPEG
jgi:hypothetical protein